MIVPVWLKRGNFKESKLIFYAGEFKLWLAPVKPINMIFHFKPWKARAFPTHTRNISTVAISSTNAMNLAWAEKGLP